MKILDWLRQRQETPESRRILGEDARQLLENKLLQASFAMVGEYLDRVALSCDPDNKDQAQRIILTKQLFASLRREIERCIEDGEVARVEIAELEKTQRVRQFRR